jgi:hypothetical protein
MEIFAGLIVVLVIIYALIVLEDKLNNDQK